jgi:clan AA aspartic protease (TIGR02281 family)
MKLTFCLLLLLPVLADAAVYKCVDNGRASYSATPCGANAQRLSEQGSEQPQPEHGTTLTLYLRADHSFRVPGTINNHPVEFVIDTGASSTVISQHAASAAGIKSCTGLGYSATANGMVRNCVATVPELSFGTFHLSSQMVTILPNLNVDGLLGMDVLRRMKVEQRGDVMYISN